MVTNSKFDENAIRIGNYYNIKMIDGSSLKEEFRKYGIRYTLEPVPDSPFLKIVKSFINLTKQL
jgi:hypothetical protein